MEDLMPELLGFSGDFNFGDKSSSYTATFQVADDVRVRLLPVYLEEHTVAWFRVPVPSSTDAVRSTCWYKPPRKTLRHQLERTRGIWERVLRDLHSVACADGSEACLCSVSAGRCTAAGDNAWLA